jgi:integrase/recombinase XerC
MPLIDHYLEWLRQCSRTPDTIHKREKILRKLDTELPHGCERVTEKELSDWLYRDEWSQSTRATYASCLRSFYSWAAGGENPWIPFDPTKDLPRVPHPRGVARPCTDEQLTRILTEAREPYRLWMLIAAYQGLRCCEISRLDREHVTEQTLFVIRGKGGRPRWHDTDPYVWAALRNLPAGPVAIWNGRRATAQEISVNAAVYFRRRMKMPGVALHRGRHWLGVTSQREGKDIRVTQELLGHASLSSTQIYTQATPEQQRAVRARLPRLAG